MQSILREECRPLALFETYWAMIHGSIDSRQYQKLYVAGQAEPVDVMDIGNFSCAYYVSSILMLCGLIQGGVHTTVDETRRDMLDSGWYPIESLQEGCVVLWGEANICSDGKFHQHIGFYVGGNEAVSNHPQLRVPKQHHVTFGQKDGQPVRGVRGMYFCPQLVHDKEG